jgi:hypothetical protein
MLADDEEWSISRHYYAVLSVPCKHSVVKAIRVDSLCHNIDNYRITGYRGSSHNIDSTRCGNCALPVVLLFESGPWTVDTKYSTSIITHHNNIIFSRVTFYVYCSPPFSFLSLIWNDQNDDQWPTTNQFLISKHISQFFQSRFFYDQ